MLSLKAQPPKTERRTESAQASDSRALTSPGGNAVPPAVLSCFASVAVLCYAAFAEEGFIQSVTS